MIKTLSKSDFVDEWNHWENSNDTFTFTYEGKCSLFDYLEQYEESTGVPIELDIIALCCEYTEYKNLAELQESYPKVKTMEELEDNTLVIPIDDGYFCRPTNRFIIANY